MKLICFECRLPLGGSASWIAEWPEWEEAADYDSYADFSDSALAWEFLRRNVHYRRDWARLEDYRKHGQQERRTGRDEVLNLQRSICKKYSIADGEMPPNPFHGPPPLFVEGKAAGERSCSGFEWLEIFVAEEPLKGKPLRTHEASSPYITVRLALDCPLEPQIKELKRVVQAIRKASRISVQAPIVQRPSRQESLYPEYLRLLDAAALGVRQREMAERIYPRTVEESMEKIRRQLRIARRLSAGGYLRILRRYSDKTGKGTNYSFPNFSRYGVNFSSTSSVHPEPWSTVDGLQEKRRK